MSGEIIISSVQSADWPMIERMGGVLAKSGLATNTRTPEQAIVKIWFGRELGLSAVMSVQDIHFIDGKPTVGINIMQALLARGGVTWSVKETDGGCEIVFSRPGWKDMAVEFTDADAKAAGLSGKSNWQKFRSAMLYARCFAKGARRIGSDLLNGCCYTPEELGAEVDDDGDIVPPKSVESVTIAPPQRTKPKSAPKPEPTDQPDDEVPPQPPAPPPDAECISDAQRRRLFKLASDAGKSVDSIKAYLAETWGITSSKAIPVNLYDSICQWAEARE